MKPYELYYLTDEEMAYASLTVELLEGRTAEEAKSAIEAIVQGEKINTSALRRFWFPLLKTNRVKAKMEGKTLVLYPDEFVRWFGPVFEGFLFDLYEKYAVLYTNKYRMNAKEEAFAYTLETTLAGLRPSQAKKLLSGIAKDEVTVRSNKVREMVFELRGIMRKQKDHDAKQIEFIHTVDKMEFEPSLEFYTFVLDLCKEYKVVAS